jgi:hypothetical protein
MQTSLRVVVGVALYLGLLDTFACSSSDDAGPPPADGGNADSRDGCGAGCTDTGTTLSDAGDAGAGKDADAAPQRGRGSIAIAQSIAPPPDGGEAGADAATVSTTAGATFTVGGVSACTIPVVDGPCEFYSCTIFGAGGAQNVWAGDVTISGTNLPDGGVTLGRTDAGYASALGNVPVFTGAETYAVRATGDTVPAFTVTGVTGVRGAVLTAPAFSSAGVDVPRTAPLGLTWTGGGPGKARFSMVTVGLPVYVAACSFPAAAGSGSVPVATLQRFAAGTALATFDVASSATADAGSFDLTVYVTSSGGDLGFLKLQ